MTDTPHIDRRSFLQATTAGLALAGISHTAVAAPTEPAETELDHDITTTVDILVVGGGTAGTIAAIQAGPGRSQDLAH